MTQEHTYQNTIDWDNCDISNIVDNWTKRVQPYSNAVPSLMASHCNWQGNRTTTVKPRNNEITSDTEVS